MTPLLSTYSDELDIETKELLKEAKQSKHFINALPLPTRAFSTTNSEYLHLVSVQKAKWQKNADVIRLHVKTSAGVICVTIRYHDENIYKRYRAVLDRLRTTDIEVTFPLISIHHSNYGLYFTADDFKVRDTIPKPSIQI